MSEGYEPKPVEGFFSDFKYAAGGTTGDAYYMQIGKLVIACFSQTGTNVNYPLLPQMDTTNPAGSGLGAVARNTSVGGVLLVETYNNGSGGINIVSTSLPQGNRMRGMLIYFTV